MLPILTIVMPGNDIMDAMTFPGQHLKGMEPAKMLDQSSSTCTMHSMDDL